MMNPEPAAGAGRPQQTATDDSPWWLKYAIRFLGSVSSLACLALGAMACITITPKCLLAGIVQMLNGVLVALIEAPCLCMFLDFAQVPSNFFDGKPPWYRGLLYVIISILPISICPGISTFFGSGLVFITGCLYGIMALGKKAPVEQMRMKASSSYNLLQNSRAAGDVETGSTMPKSTEPPRSGVI
ncbi:calcium channel flower-like [Uloborus diversus]|uniref:calcium channel flower-like n=1 Tax=Uloborus diversus TaxID=327109 RepID=UPI0024097947|nr:calcium channel flower-like [Uloborus diversus]